MAGIVNRAVLSENDNVNNECVQSSFIRKYELPKLETTFPFERCPLESSPKVEEWLKWNFESSLMPRDKFKKYSEVVIFASYFYPFCTDLGRYENLVDVMVLFFVFDDHTEFDWGDVARNKDEGRRIWGQFELALKKLISNEHVPMNNWKPYVMAMFACSEDICSKYNQVQKKRFVACWQEYIDGNLEETQVIHDGFEFLDYTDMMKIRLKTIGFRPALQLIEYAENIFVPDEDWVDKEFQTLMDLWCEVTVTVNDFYSFEKELALRQKGDLYKMYNLVALIARLESIPISKALDKIAQITRELEVKIKSAKTKMLLNPKWSKATLHFLESVEYCSGGNWKVHTLLDRYHNFM